MLSENQIINEKLILAKILEIIPEIVKSFFNDNSKYIIDRLDFLNEIYLAWFENQHETDEALIKIFHQKSNKLYSIYFGEYHNFDRSADINQEIATEGSKEQGNLSLILVDNNDPLSNLIKAEARAEQEEPEKPLINISELINEVETHNWQSNAENVLAKLTYSEYVLMFNKKYRTL